MSHQVDEHWSLGLGFYGDFGLALDYDDDWAGRYQIQNPSIMGASLVPSSSYRVNDEWSLGLGLRAMYAMLDSEAAIDRAPFSLLDRADGQFSYQDQAWGYGARLGVIYAPRPGTRIGLAYSSAIDLDFDEHLDVDGSGPLLTRLDNSKLQLDMTVPQTLTLSLYQQLDEQWAVLATINWQDWSEFGEIGVEVDTTASNAQSQTFDASYKDTWHLALGAQYQATRELLWNVGVAYDSSAVSDSDRSVVLPMADSWRVGTGATYRLDRGTDLNVSWDLIWFGDMPVEQTKPLSGQRLSGEFKDAWVQTLTGNMTWRF